MSRHVFALVCVLHGCGTNEVTGPVTAGAAGSTGAAGTGGAAGAPSTWSLTPPAEMPCGDGLQADAPWPTAGRCNSRTSRSPFVGPRTGAVKWTYEHPKGQVNGVAVAADGTLYLGSSDGLLALDPAGTLKWTAALGEIDTTPTIAHDGSVLVTTSTLQGAVLHVVSPDGQEIWSHDGFSPDNPTVIDDGTAYVSIPGGKLGILAADRTIAGLIAVEPDWRSFGLAIAPGGDLVTWSYGNLPDDPGHLQRRSASGAWKWMVGVSCERVLVDGDGVTYCGDGAHIRAFDVAGAELWTREGRGVAVTHDGKLVSAVAGALRKYARDGQIEWATPLVMAGAPVIDAEDTLYVDTQGGVVAVGADGAVRWSLGASAWYLVLGREHELYAITTTTVTAVGP